MAGVRRGLREIKRSLSPFFVTNANAIVKSLVEGKFFSGNKEGGTVEYSTAGDLDYSKMFKFANSSGAKGFGFGDGNTYCAHYAANVIRAGGGKVREEDAEKMQKEVDEKLKGKSSAAQLRMVPGILFDMIQRGPTGHNIRNAIKKDNKGLPFGKFKF